MEQVNMWYIKSLKEENRAKGFTDQHRHPWLGENSLKNTDGKKKKRAKQNESRYKVISQSNEKRSEKGKEEGNEISLKMQEKGRRKMVANLKRGRRVLFKCCKKRNFECRGSFCVMFSEYQKSGENISPASNFFLNDENLGVLRTG